MKWLKVLLFLKISAIVLLVLFKFRILEFGQNPSIAQTNTEPKENDSDQSKIEKSMSAQQIANHELMQDLLSMPELDPKNATKKSLQKYISLLDSKKRKIENRLSMLAEKIKTYEDLEKSLDKKIETIGEEAKFFQQTLQKEKKVKKERLDKLITFYEKMEPKKAAPILEVMDKDLVVSLLSAIKQSQVTTIIQSMDPEIAKDLTEYYGRIRSTNEYDLLKEMNQSLKDAFSECKKN